MFSKPKILIFSKKNDLFENKTYQNIILNVFAIRRAKHTSNENPSVSWVLLICLYCGIYGTTPPTIIAPALTQPTTWPTVNDNSSEMTQSIFISCRHNFSLQELSSFFNTVFGSPSPYQFKRQMI